MAGLVTLTGGTFQDAAGNLLVDGYLSMELVQDEQLSMSQGQAVGGRKITIQLGTDGNVLVSPAQKVWPTDEMNPGNASYTVWGYTAEGQLVWGPNYGLLVPTGSTYNVDGWVPNQIGGSSGSGGAPVGSLLLQTNGVNNGSQQLLNLVEGSGITIVDDGVGDITISAASTVVDLMTTDWHKLEFSNLTGSPTFNGDGISVLAANLGGSLNGIQGRAPFGANPAATQIGGAQPQQAAIYEYGVDTNLGAVNSGPINLSTLVRWQASIAVGTMYLGAWAPNTRVPSGTVLKVSTTYYVQTASAGSASITGSGSAPSFSSTPGDTTSDNSATWTSVGTTRPITFGDHMIGISDYEGTNIGTGFSQYPLGGDPTLTNAPGPAYNFIGFRYLPEPLASNGNVGDVHWMAYAGGVGMTPTIVDTGIAPDNSGATHVFAIKQPTANSITFYIDGALVATIAISGLTNAFQSLVYGSNQQGDYDYSYAAAQAVGLGASVHDSGNWWECVAAGTTTGITFTASPSAGQIDADGAVSWMCVFGAGGTETSPMAISPAYIFWETSE